MALLRSLLIAAVLLTAFNVHAHHMGRTVPIGFSDSGFPHVHLAAQVVASYFEEQMGRETSLFAKSDASDCLRAIVEKEAPIGVIPMLKAEEMPDSVVAVLPGLDTGAGIIALIMGREARKDLQFSLVPRYMELLSSRLTIDAWAKGIIRVNGGEGVRKVALDMLREADLL